MWGEGDREKERLVIFLEKGFTKSHYNTVSFVLLGWNFVETLYILWQEDKNDDAYALMHLCMKAVMYITMMQLLWCGAMRANEFSFFSWVESMQAAYISTFHKTWFDPTSYNVEMMTGVAVHTGYQGAVQLSNAMMEMFLAQTFATQLVHAFSVEKMLWNVSCFIKHFYWHIFY